MTVGVSSARLGSAIGRDIEVLSGEQAGDSLVTEGSSSCGPSTAALLPFLAPDLACGNENCTSLWDRSRLNVGRPPRNRLDRRGFPTSKRVVDARAFDALAHPRHFAIWVTSRGPTIVPRSDGRAGCQQQYGQIRFAQIDVGLHDKDHIQLDAHGRMPRPVLRCGMRQKRFWIATTKNACPMPQKCSRSRQDDGSRSAGRRHHEGSAGPGVGANRITQSTSPASVRGRSAAR